MASPIFKRSIIMKRLKQRWVFMGLCICVFILTGSIFHSSGATDLIPAGVVVKETYRPGVGASVGEISQVAGKAAVIHINDKEGYWAREGNKLFKGDTIITLADGYTAFKLEDGSFMTLSPETKLEITNSVYAPEKKSRSTFLNIVAGKTRFIVKKLVDARHSEFKVKTTTSVAGVRGSDFVITATETASEVTALQHTELEVISLAVPDVKPTILHDFERTTVRKGAAAEDARKVSAEEIDRLMKEFKFQPSDTSLEGVMEPKKEQTDAENKPLSTDQFDTMVLREEDLVRPDFRFTPDMLNRLSVEERYEFRRLIKEENTVEGTKTTILHQQYEDIQKSNLPDFPGTP
jgi:hypothetical protein